MSKSFLILASMLMTSAAPCSQAWAGLKCGNDVKTSETGPAAQWLKTGRALSDNGFLNIAFRSYERALEAAGSASEAGSAIAALDCLEEIQSTRRGLALPKNNSLLIALSSSAAADSAEREILERYALRLMLQGLGSSSDSEPVQAILKSRARASALAGLRDSAQGNWSSASRNLKSTLTLIEEGSAPSDVKALKAEIRLALARALYALGKSSAAVEQYQTLFAIGKPMQDALLESAWSQLRDQNYSKAIGLSFELQTGKLSRFFVPEAPSVRAIAFVENCRYGEAKQAADGFSKEYVPLVKWLKQSSDQSSLYELAVARAEGAMGEDSVPDRVWSIWSSSSVFQALQSDIRASFEEESAAQEWLIDESDADKKLREFVASEHKQLASARQQMARRIESHLERLNRSMISRIEAESERLRFVRIETNQGAGREMIAINAKPELEDYDGVEPKPGASSKKAKLKWGKARTEDPRAEIWIDEIGGYEGKALNRCLAHGKFQKRQVAGGG